MIRGWLIYNREDAVKNQYFIRALIEYAQGSGIDLKCVFREKVTLGIEENSLFAAYEGEKSSPQIAINRSRDSFIARHLEIMGVKVYNTSEVTRLCNHKARTHQMITELKIPTLDTLFLNKRFFDVEKLNKVYPVVLKSTAGHGGREVFKCEGPEDVVRQLHKINEEEFIIQTLCNQTGVDVRVFVMGERILGAIKRESQTDFRSNYSLGGSASLYPLSKEIYTYVKKIISHLQSDFIGIDFMLDQKGNPFLNEIEDAVGSRTLYEYGHINTAKEYIHYIKNTAKKLL